MDEFSRPFRLRSYTLPFGHRSRQVPTAGTPGTSVIFNDQSTGFPAPASWYWDFGDGYNSTQQNPSHQYVSSGLYNVSSFCNEFTGNPGRIKPLLSPYHDT